MIVVAIAFLWLLGCSPTPMSVIMTNPQTGKSVYIAHHSWGWGAAGLSAAITAELAQRKAVEAAKMMGYTQIQEVK